MSFEKTNFTPLVANLHMFTIIDEHMSLEQTIMASLDWNDSDTSDEDEEYEKENSEHLDPLSRAQQQSGGKFA